ncbi:MAG: hypothetical protein ACM37W_09180 [Actinomycetota bacterium]
MFARKCHKVKRTLIFSSQAVSTICSPDFLIPANVTGKGNALAEFQEVSGVTIARRQLCEEYQALSRSRVELLNADRSPALAWKHR